MSDDELSPEDKELEAKLRRLVPSSGMKEDFIIELTRDHERIISQASVNPRQSKWMMAALMACFFAFCGTTFLKFKSESSNPPVAKLEEPGAKPSKTNEFVPISSSGYLINAVSGGIVDSDNGPQERFELRYEDVDHWYNPNTSTDIQIFSPRRETITIPIQID